MKLEKFSEIGLFELKRYAGMHYFLSYAVADIRTLCTTIHSFVPGPVMRLLSRPCHIADALTDNDSL